MESVLRLLWVDANLPSPLVNASIFDQRGRFVARPDLLDPTSGLIGEYNGAWHKLGAQPRRDRARERAIERLGFKVVNIGASDMESGGRLALDVLTTARLSWRTEGTKPFNRVLIVPQG
jgi:hypothetical protein